MDTAQIDNVMYTRKGERLFALIPLQEGELLGKTLHISTDRRVEQACCLGFGRVTFEQTNNGVTVSVPEELVGTDPYAIVFEIN